MEDKKANIIISRYNKYLDNTVIILTTLILILAGSLFLLWEYYVPSKKKRALQIEYTDNRNPPELNPTSSTSKTIKDNIPSNGNLQAPGEGLNNYLKAGLRQFCSLGDTSNSTNSPEDFTLQPCEEGLVCTPNILAKGPICLASIGSACDSLGDCVPEADICLEGKCSLVDFKNKINTVCEGNNDCNLDIFEDNINNHFCYKTPGKTRGSCKVNIFPFDGGCTLDSQCPTVIGKDIRCVKQKNFTDVLMGASIFCSTGESCQNGNGLSIVLDQKLNLNFLVDSSQTFMLKLFLDEGTNLLDPSAQFPFVVSGVCNDNNGIFLEPLEFFAGYKQIDNNSRVKVYFGDYPGTTAISNDIPYGVCIELLPFGSPANYKIANVSIPPADLLPSRVVDNIFVNADRNSPGALNTICLNNAPEGSILSCGETTFAGQKWGLSCGYNYNLEEFYLDSIYYGLSPDAFNLKNLGNCMIKNTFKNQICNNSTKGCFDNLICLPITIPNSDNITNYCVTPFRSQICDNNQCPDGYECSPDNFCLSKSNNLAYLSSDCLSGSTDSTSLYLYFYDLKSDSYKRLSINLYDVLTPFGAGNLENISIKLSKNYSTVNEYTELGIANKSRLPQKILLYADIDKKVVILKFVSGRGYIIDQYFFINQSPNSTIHSVHFGENDNTLAVVQKRTSPEFREQAYKVASITSSGGLYYININITGDDSDWYAFNILRDSEEYFAYLYSSSDSSFNTKGKGEMKIAKTYTENGQNFLRDYLEVEGENWPGIKDYNGEGDLFIVFNKNSFAFNNAVYMSSGYNFASTYKNLLFPGGDNPSTQLARNINGSNSFNTNGENFFLLPKIYRNTGTILNPVFDSKNYTPLENGDSLTFEEDFTFFNIKDFQPTSDLTNKTVVIDKDKTLYSEKIQSYYYFKNGQNNQTNLDLIVLNLHSDYLSSEGSVPIFDNFSANNQNFFKNNNDVLNPDGSGIVSSINFTAYKDMVNYNVEFINLDRNIAPASSIGIEDSPTFIGVSRSDGTSLIITNGLNNSITYNFEKETEVTFDFYSEDNKNYILLKSAVQGDKDYHNYIQKIEYKLEAEFSSVFNASDEYDYFYSSGRNNISFKYLNNIIAPKPKNFYFDSNINVNTIDKVSENLYDSNNDSISIFSTFNNDSFIKESGFVEEDILDINKTNVYSNRAPPLASYSRLNNVNVTKDGEDLNVNYQGLNFVNKQEFNFLELENGISRTFGLSGDCLNTNNNLGTNFITLRSPEIIDLFLSNPSSEIVLQKDGDTLEEFYVTKGVAEGASYAAKNFGLIDGSRNPQIGSPAWFNDSNPVNFTIDYNQNTNLQNIFQNNNIQLNRSVIEISEYDIFINEEGNVSEYMIIKLNASIDINEVYVENIFNNTSKWKVWHNNFVPLSYHNGYQFTAFSNRDNIEIITHENDDENLITIMDGSPVWGAAKSSSFEFAEGYGKSSFNKLLLYSEANDSFDIFNVHDGYFNKTVDIFFEDFRKETFTYVPIQQDDNFEAISNYIETIVNYNFLTATAIAPPGDSNLPTNLITEDITFMAEPSAILGIKGQDDNVVTLTVTGNTDQQQENRLKPIKWNLSSYFDEGSFFNFENIEASKVLPKKVKLFDVTLNINFKNLHLIQGSSYSSELLQTDFKQRNFTNNEFVYFKKKYFRKLVVAEYIADYINEHNNIIYDNFPITLSSFYGNNHTDTINLIVNYEDFYGSKIASQIISDGINSSVSPNSFVTSYPVYRNSLKPIIYQNLANFNNTEYFTQISYKINGSYEVMVYAFYDGDSLKFFNFISNIEMRPINSSSICLPDKFTNYNKKLYMINNLFLSSLPRVNPSFNYLGSKITNDYIISNIYYDKDGNKKYKGLGVIKFKIDGSPIFSNNKAIKNSYNQINYNTVKFPQDFTERFVSRVNAIPRIKQIFTDINQGNIYNNLNFYVYLDFSTIENIQDDTNGLLYMGTDSDLETILENRGVAYTPSLSKGNISLDILKNILVFEPYNKFLITLARSCS